MTNNFFSFVQMQDLNSNPSLYYTLLLIMDPEWSTLSWIQ